MDFPPIWQQFFDDAVPHFVKRKYSPNPAWKSRPFTRQDANFFSRGIIELSDLFTDDRDSRPKDYFAHPKFRSSYLLYYLPLHAAKFFTLLRGNPKALDHMLKGLGPNEPLRVLDLGSGPGTASFAFVLAVYLHLKGKPCPPIELHWIDQNFKSLKDGSELMEELKKLTPTLKINIELHEQDFRKSLKIPDLKFSMILAGNVFNEKKSAAMILDKVFPRISGGGLLIVEPAARGPSQLLSQIRNEAIEEGAIKKIWEPCPHLGPCPLAMGRDWCHFSVRSRIPGEWFTYFSKGLGSIREWLKYTYLWIAPPDATVPPLKPNERLVISDPLDMPGGKRSVLLCEPERAGRMPLRPGQTLLRGDIATPRVK